MGHDPAVLLTLDQVDFSPIVLREDLRTKGAMAACHGCGHRLSARTHAALQQAMADHDEWHVRKPS